jgi:hypothetical protein
MLMKFTTSNCKIFYIAERTSKLVLLRTVQDESSSWQGDKLGHLYIDCKLVETFHIVSECKTAIYFSWCLINALAQPVQLFDRWSLFSIASHDSWTDSDLQLLTEREQDQTRLSFIQYIDMYILALSKLSSFCKIT